MEKQLLPKSVKKKIIIIPVFVGKHQRGRMSSIDEEGAVCSPLFDGEKLSITTYGYIQLQYRTDSFIY